MRTRALAPIMVLAAVTLIAATGACLVHADDSAPDLCPSLLAMTVGLLLPFSLGLSGQFILARPDGYDLSPFDLPAPPPKA